MPTRGAWFLALILGVTPLVATAEKPLSAIDWLSKSIGSDQPMVAPVETNGSQANLPPVKGEASVSSDTLPDPVATSVLGGPSLDAAGLLPPNVTGLPRDLWGIGRSVDIAGLIATVGQGDVPALQSQLMSLLLAEAAPPVDAAGDGALLLARIDRLLEMGALDQAQALIEDAGANASPELFRRSFDVGLLTGQEDAACEVLKTIPGLAPTVTTRVFCLARSGDWNAAALTLRTAQALGNVSETDNQLLTRFLDPGLFDDDKLPPPPSPITPLIWRIYDALGEPLPTATLPPAFAHAELSENAGWKAQIEAAERLERAGVISPNVLLGLYTSRAPAASGGVWDRADAFQRFDAALSKGDVTAIEQRLPLAYARMMDVELEVPFATLFAEELATYQLKGDAARIAFELGLLSPAYERLGKTAPLAADARSIFLVGLVNGSVDGLVAPDSMARAIAPAFSDPVYAADIQTLVDQRRIGEAILTAISLVDQGLVGDTAKVSQGLAALRLLGLEDCARRTALQLMILERRG